MGLTRRCFMAAGSAILSVLEFLEPRSYPEPMTPAPPPRRKQVYVEGGELPWGTYGKSGNEPLKWKRLDECSNEHLEAILRTQPISPRYREVIGRILESRKVR